MKFTALAIDDEPYVLLDFLNTLKLFPKLIVLASFHCVKEALAFLTENGPVNFIFCDIDMPVISGIEAGKILKSHCDVLMYTTAYSQFRTESNSVGASRYSIKPVPASDIHEVMEYLKKIKTGIQLPVKPLPKFLKVMDLKNFKQNLDLDQIISITNMDNYIKFHTEKAVYTQYASMMQIAEELCGTGRFFRINRSTIISIPAIKSVKNDFVLLKNGQRNRISRLKKAEFLKTLDETLYL